MSVMKNGLSGPYQLANVFYQLIASLGRLGIDPQLFFKVYPPIIFALTALLLAVYARRALKWAPRALVVFGFVYSFLPALLRSSSDLQRQNFALLLLALILVVDTIAIDRKWRWGAFVLFYVAIGLTHELVFGVAVAILVWKILKPTGGVRDFKRMMLLVAVVSLVIVFYVVATASSVQGLLAEVFTINYHPLGTTFASPWEGVDWGISLCLLSMGLMLPLSFLGYFRDDALSPWLLITAIPLVSFLVSYVSFNFPDRWLYLAGIPIAFYVSNFLRKLNGRTIAPYCMIGLLAIQPLSMIGATPLPFSLYAEKRYGTFSDLLAPSLPDDQIAAIRTLSQIATIPSPTTFIVPFALANWVGYYFPRDTILLNDSNEAGNVIRFSMNFVFVSYNGMSPNLGRNVSLALSYGGLSFYEVKEG
jgi:hypothetical protein